MKESSLQPVGPIEVVELFPPLSRELLSVLKSISPEDWARPTPCAPWTVKDVAAHLLGGNFGRLWPTRLIPDESPAVGFEALVDVINRENACWVQAARRISPELLVDLLELTDQRLYQHFRSLDPNEPARITVAWAGDELPPNWMDIAREFTEKWLHQQHIREAVGRPLLTGRKWMEPVLDTFLRGLPRAFMGQEAENGVSVSVQITGEGGADWSLVREAGGWRLFTGRNDHAVSRVQMDADLAWRLFTRGVTPQEARHQVILRGDLTLGERVLETVSIMA